MREFTLAFHGGAETVTGSKHLLTVGDERVLIDYGMFQGERELRDLNWQAPAFEPTTVGKVLLTHAHMDHSGLLPRLVTQGFAGEIVGTGGTCELVRVLLYDSAKLQEEDARYANKKGYAKHAPALPLYTEKDVDRTLKLMRPMPMRAWQTIGEGIEVRLHNAGHILGSTFAEVRVLRDGVARTIVFSGDLGRYGVPLHRDPDPLPACDALVVESTYGDRKHETAPMIDRIREPFKRTLARGGIILIPSFAVARVQLVTLMLRELQESGDIPDVPIHIDSPMAAKVTEIYRRHVHAGELDEALSDEEWKRLFPQDVEMHASVAESKRLNELAGPRIIISSSGMLTGGRVLHHLERLAPDARNLIVLVGYQAAGTRGRQLFDGATALKMHGRMVPIRAGVLTLAGLSAHGDADELMRWIGSAPTPPREVFVTHGEPPASEILAGRVRAELGVKAHVPRLHEEFDLAELLG
jgi:metallo-beta-lactamase family protein